MLYARKRIKSGPMLEDLYYPVQPSGRLAPGSIPKTSGTSEAQEKYNEKKATFQAIRVANATFDTGDLWITLTYSDDNPHRPVTYKQATARLTSYLRRVRRYRAAHGMPEMAYMYKIEEKKRRSGALKGETVYHYHLLMTEMDRNKAEELWIYGERVNADRFNPWRFGQEAAARYMTKKSSKFKDQSSKNPSPQSASLTAPPPHGFAAGEGAFSKEGSLAMTDEEQDEPERVTGRKRFVCSRNCKRPVMPKTQKRMTISKRKAEDMATAHEDDKAYWQAKAPAGYAYAGMQYLLNEWNGKYYWRVTYRRLPEWDTKKKKRKRGKEK